MTSVQNSMTWAMLLDQYQRCDKAKLFKLQNYKATSNILLLQRMYMEEKEKQKLIYTYLM